MKLTLFYDGQCPLCMAEMRQLKAYDTSGRVQLTNLHDPDFELQYPHIDKTRAMQILHAQLENGDMLYGLDANCEAWAQVGRHRWLKLLRWPVIRTIADRVYLLFARHRSQIAALVTGKSHCDSCSLAETESACQTNDQYRQH